MHIYLANKYFEAAEYQAASEHVEDYIAGFGKDGMTNTDQALALRLYADILVKQHHISKAIRALDQAMARQVLEIALIMPLKKANYAPQEHDVRFYVLPFYYIRRNVC